MHLFYRVIILSLLWVLTPLALADSHINSFIGFSDIHFDPFHNCQPEMRCLLIGELNKADAKQWPAIFEKYDKGPVATYHADTNYPLLKSTLAQIQYQVKKHNAKFALITGDFIGHEFKKKYVMYTQDKSEEGYQKFVKKTLEFLEQEIRKDILNIPIYPVVGNNDTYGGDYVTVPNGQFFKNTKQVWLPFLRKNSGTFRATFPIAGYYAVTPTTEVRWHLIILNSILFMKEAQNPATEQAAKKQIEWMKGQLKYAEKNHQKVLLIFHIPMGIDTFKTAKAGRGNIAEFWALNYTKEFLSIINQYQGIISGLISGHLHMDVFQVLSTKSSAIFNTSIPSISPIFSNNPGFKVYNYNAKNLKLKNYSTYYLDESHHEPKWQLEYTFNDSYKLNCKSCDLLIGMQKLQPNNEYAKLYQKYYASSSEQAPFIRDKWPYAWCGVHNVTVEHYRNCLEVSQ